MIRLFRLLLIGTICVVSAAPLSEAAAARTFEVAGKEVARWEAPAAVDGMTRIPLDPQFARRQRQDNQPYLELLISHNVHIGEDGRVVRKTKLVRQFLNATGIADHGNSYIFLNTFNQSLTINEAYTRLRDGRTLAVDPQSVQVTTDGNQNVFSDSVRFAVPFPALRPEAVTVLAFTVTEDAAKWPLPWSTTFYPRAFNSTAHFELTLTWDEHARPVRLESDLDSLSCSRTSERRIDCRAGQIEPLKQGETVNYWNHFNRIIVAEDAAWSSIGQRMTGIVDDAASADVTLSSILKRILRGAVTPDEKLARIHRFVSRDIRYVAFEHGTGGIVPRPATLTLKTRFGDCKDKTTLFIALTRLAGFEAYPVLTSTEVSNLRPLLLPATTYFNHMVGCAVLPDGRERCMDLTDPHTAYGSLPESLDGAIRLDIRGAATEGPRQFGRRRFLSMFEVTSVATFGDDGAYHETQNIAFKDAYATNVRWQLAGRSHQERKRYLIEMFQSVVSDRVEPEVSYDNLQRIDRPLVIRTQTTFEDVFDPRTMVDWNDLQAWLVNALRHQKSRNKVYAYQFGGLLFSARTTVRLPRDRRVLYRGPTVDFHNRFGRYLRSGRISGGELRIFTSLTLPARELSLPEVREFNAFIDFLIENARTQFAVVAPDQGTGRTQPANTVSGE